jgi:DNA-binding NarL/FixJ family response regulator
MENIACSCGAPRDFRRPVDQNETPPSVLDRLRRLVRCGTLAAPPMASVLLVEDDPLIARVVRLLVQHGSHRLVATCGDVTSGFEAVVREAPDVLLLDLGLPGVDGRELLRLIRELDRPPAAIVITVFDDDGHLFDALRAGAVGYLLKDHMPDRLLGAIDDAMNGGAPMSPGIARRVLGRAMNAPNPRPSVPPKSSEPALTPREREVTELLARGETYDEIALALGVSTNTVRSYVRSIYEKLHASSKTEAVLEAMRRGLLPPDARE